MHLMAPLGDPAHFRGTVLDFEYPSAQSNARSELVFFTFFPLGGPDFPPALFFPSPPGAKAGSIARVADKSSLRGSQCWAPKCSRRKSGTSQGPNGNTVRPGVLYVGREEGPRTPKTSDKDISRNKSTKISSHPLRFFSVFELNRRRTPESSTLL